MQNRLSGKAKSLFVDLDQSNLNSLFHVICFGLVRFQPSLLLSNV